VKYHFFTVHQLVATFVNLITSLIPGKKERGCTCSYALFPDNKCTIAVLRPEEHIKVHAVYH